MISCASLNERDIFYVILVPMLRLFLFSFYFSFIELPSVVLEQILQLIGLKKAVKISHLHSRLHDIVFTCPVIWHKVKFVNGFNPSTKLFNSLTSKLAHVRFLQIPDSLTAGKGTFQQFSIDYFAFRMILSTKLTFLDLSGSSISTLCFVPHLISLRVLIMHNCPMLNSYDFECLAPASKTLTKIFIGGNRITADEALRWLPRHSEIVGLQGVVFDADQLVQLGYRFSHLKEVYLATYIVDNILLMAINELFPDLVYHLN